MPRPKQYPLMLRFCLDEELMKALDEAQRLHDRPDRSDTVRFLLRKALRGLKLLPEPADPRS